MESIASYIDHTFLQPTAVYIDIKKICEETIHYHFAAACIPPPFVKFAREWLNEKAGSIATVIGFPFGYSTPAAKFAEARQSLRDGADELDVVINIAALKNRWMELLQQEMQDIIEVTHDQGKIVKVIIETGVLTDSEIGSCCELYSKLGADFLKTSTGYAEKGASVQAVELMKSLLPPNVKIKASGGIRSYRFAKDLVAAGASRLGCSASIAILKEEKEAKENQDK